MEAGGRGRLTPPPLPTHPQAATNQTQKEAASDNTNSTMIGSDGSQSAAKKWWRDYRLLFLFASADRVGEEEEEVIGGR